MKRARIISPPWGNRVWAPIHLEPVASKFDLMGAGRVTAGVVKSTGVYLSESGARERATGGLGGVADRAAAWADCRFD